MTKTVSAEVKATCTEAGKEAVIGCSRCDHTEGGETIDALGHDFAAEFTVDKEAVRRHNRRGFCTKIKVRYVPPTMCRLTLSLPHYHSIAKAAAHFESYVKHLLQNKKTLASFLMLRS